MGIVFLITAPHYLESNTFGLVGVFLALYCFRPRAGEQSFRYVWFVLGFGIITSMMYTVFGLYCIVLFSILTVIELFWGKLSIFAPVYGLILSPLFNYFGAFVSFPLRMELSKIAGGLFQNLGFNMTISGNLITLNGNEFLVDTACMGLHMLGYSLLFGIAIMCIQERKKGKLNWFNSITLLMILFALNLIANLIRIMLLVLFKVAPGHWFHEAIGLITFGCFILVPFYLTCNLFIKNKKRDTTYYHIPSFHRASLASICLLFVTAFSFSKPVNLDQITTTHPVLHLTNYTSTIATGGVTQLKNDRALIYIKPPVEAFRPDHNPLFCWEGSGYAFKHIQHDVINDQEVFLCTLEKGDDRLISCWWYESKHTRLADQLLWRWKAIENNEEFGVVNITAANKGDLEAAVAGYFEEVELVE